MPRSDSSINNKNRRRTMNTKNIFKTLALAMLMPAMLLTTACSSDDDAIVNNEPTAKKGYTIPVTVNVTREGDEAANSRITRATYNEGTKKLEFSSGDKLFVWGNDTRVDGGAGYFAGTLDYVPASGQFTGIITTQKVYTGTADALFTATSSSGEYLTADLLPADHEDYRFIYIQTTGGNGYDNVLNTASAKAFATSKATAVEQFSLEEASTYSSGFALHPLNAILNFTISGLTPSTEVTATLTNGGSLTITGNVTTNASGEASFAMAVSRGTNLNSLSLTVGGNEYTLLRSSKTLEAGHVYNINRPLTYPIALSSVTSAYVGSVITTDGNVYATVADATAASKTAVAMITYVGAAGSADASSASYKGLALALTDALVNAGNLDDPHNYFQWCTINGGQCLPKWYDNNETTDMAGIANTDALVNHVSHTHDAATKARSYNSGTHPTGTSEWFLPSAGQLDKMITTAGSYTALRDGFSSVGGTDIMARRYWTSTECAGSAWRFSFFDGADEGNFANTTKTYANRVRPCLAF